MDTCNSPPKIGIIGAGISGLCAAIQLKKQLNIDSYTIFDENNDVGGTWLVNTYPGCACDVPSHLYSYSFEPNPNWSKAYPPQQEIWEYVRNVAIKYDLYPKIKFGHRIISSEWDETILKWRAKILNMNEHKEEIHLFDIFISGIGALRVPDVPTQFNTYMNTKMHSAEWDHSVELKDKVVAIVGSGASAVQIIPEIVDKVKKLIVYQRHPAWVVPKIQVEFPKCVQWAFSNIPGVQWVLRNMIFWSAELNHSSFKINTTMSKLAAKFGQFHLKRQIRDPILREKLTPNYTFGCKRVAPSNDYYPALAKPNVEVIRSPIIDVTEDAVINEDGTTIKPDVLILATGYKLQDFFAPLEIKAKGGIDLLQKYKKSGPCAYLGIACHHLPNGFFLLGPNTGFGHNTVIFSIECQVNWIIKVIREMTKRNARVVTVKKSAEDEYMDKILTSMQSTVWGATSCGSWYADHRGVVTALYPENLVSYYNCTKSVNFDHLEFE